MHNILIVKHGALGDVIRTSYAVPMLYEKYNPARILWFTSEEAFDLLRFNPFISHIITLKYKYHMLSEIEFDLVLSFDDEIETLKSLSSISYKKIIGAYLENGKQTYTSSSALWFDMGLISKYGKSIADSFKKKNSLEHNEIFSRILDINISAPCFWNSEIFKKNVLKIIDHDSFIIGLNSGAGERWPSKALLISEAINLTNSLCTMRVNGKKCQVVLLGGPKEKERNLAIANAVQSTQICIAPQMQLLEFAATIACCNYLISSDSLALHLAISQKIPNLSFFAPTSASEIGVFGLGVKVISLSSDYCSYRLDADNTSITSERILHEFYAHMQSISKIQVST